jgi:hypothetical protein
MGFGGILGYQIIQKTKPMEAKQIISQAASQMLPNMQDPQMILEMITPKYMMQLEREN